MPVRLFVGNLPYDATEEDIRAHFSTAGNVLNVFVPLDRETGRKRGFAFVEFNDNAQAQEAIRLFNSQPFKGRPLAVNEARAKEARPPSPGGGAGGGGFRPGPRPPSTGGFRPPAQVVFVRPARAALRLRETLIVRIRAVSTLVEPTNTLVSSARMPSPSRTAIKRLFDRKAVRRRSRNV